MSTCTILLSSMSHIITYICRFLQRIVFLAQAHGGRLAHIRIYRSDGKPSRFHAPVAVATGMESTLVTKFARKTQPAASECLCPTPTAYPTAPQPADAPPRRVKAACWYGFRAPYRTDLGAAPCSTPTPDRLGSGEHSRDSAQSPMRHTPVINIEQMISPAPDDQPPHLRARDIRQWFL
jgi:hypothetical protein